MLNAQGEQIGRTIYEQSSAGSDTARAIRMPVRSGNGDARGTGVPAGRARSEREVNRTHSDRAAQLEIVATKDPSSEQLAAWEGRLQEYPTAWRALATQYPAHGDRSSAIRCYERSVALMPTASAVALLANLHLQEGDADAWEQTLVKSLDVFDLAWDREQVYAELMRGFAERAMAKSDSARPGIRPERNIPGLMAASMACEGAAQWEESERWAASVSESHPADYAWYWYFWCGRTGRGDAETARKLVHHRIMSAGGRTGRSAREVGVYHLLRGSRRLGLLAFRRAWTLEPTYRHALIVAQLARVTGNEALRNEVLEAMRRVKAEQTGQQTPQDEAADAAGLAVLQLLQTGDGSVARLREIDQLLRTTTSTAHGEFAHIVGQELQAMGRTGEAELYWRRTLANPGGGVHYSTLAGWELAKRHITSRDEQEELPAGAASWPEAEDATAK